MDLSAHTRVLQRQFAAAQPCSDVERLLCVQQHVEHNLTRLVVRQDHQVRTLKHLFLPCHRILQLNATLPNLKCLFPDFRDVMFNLLKLNLKRRRVLNIAQIELCH